MLYPLSYGGGAGAIRGRKPGRRMHQSRGEAVPGGDARLPGTLSDGMGVGRRLQSG